MKCHFYFQSKEESEANVHALLDEKEDLKKQCDGLNKLLEEMKVGKHIFICLFSCLFCCFFYFSLEKKQAHQAKKNSFGFKRHTKIQKL